jgi:hypothetical protein
MRSTTKVRKWTVVGLRRRGQDGLILLLELSVRGETRREELFHLLVNAVRAGR